MGLLKRNIAANFAGSLWQALMGLAFIPLYIKFMGIESWGLIGLFATIQPMLGLLDMGLSSTLNREMARLSVLPQKEQEMRNVVRTLEVFCWGMAVMLGITAAALSPFMANHWIKAWKLSAGTIEQALLIMGLVMALQMPIAFYSGGLMGLQKQVLLNVIAICMNTLRGAGAVLVLWLVSPTIQAFFSWQIVVSITNIIFLAAFIWRSLPAGNTRAVFQREILKEIWKFAAGISGITILAVILTQLDKIILSRMLSLEMFGYYTLASVVAMSLNRLFGPVFLGIYPRLTQLISLDDSEGLRRLYHQSGQFMSILILPAAIVVALFSYEILLVWTQNPTAAENSHLLVSLLICGTAINGLMHLPYALQLASGWTRIGLNITVFLILIFFPAIIILTRYYGPVGAASAWLALNILYMLIGVPLTHQRLLRGEATKWFCNIIYPLASIVAIVFIGHNLYKSYISPRAAIASVVITFLFALMSACLSSSYIRKMIKNRFLWKRPLC
jgi:O-antigen/teichoic acid export membrane protein